MTWEFPAQASEELVAAAGILQGWRPVPGDLCLRRAYGPNPVEEDLRDPAANDPAETEPVIRRLTNALSTELASGEDVLARALLPAWANDHGSAHLLAVTGERVLWLPDPANAHHLSPAFHRLETITSLEFKSSVLESWLILNLADRGNMHRAIFPFPYTADSFSVCFTALRRQLTAVPER